MFSIGLYLNYHPSHLMWMGIDPVEAVKPYIGRIPHAQAKDIELILRARDRFGWPGKAVDRGNPWDVGWWRYRVPGRGQVDWPRLVDALYEGGFEGVLSVEHEDTRLGRLGREGRARVEDRSSNVATTDRGLMDRTPILEVSGLVKDYPGVRALAGVDSTCCPAKCTASSGRTAPASPP